MKISLKKTKLNVDNGEGIEKIWQNSGNKNYWRDYLACINLVNWALLLYIIDKNSK